MTQPEMPSPQQAEEGGIQLLFVTRLERLIRLRNDYKEDLNPLGLLLMDRAINATYRDCIDYGASERAEQLMAKHSPLPEGRLPWEP